MKANKKGQSDNPPAHHEVYENVAVMFASIPDFYLETAQDSNANANSYKGTEVFAEKVEFKADNKLTLLNQIICSFDEVRSLLRAFSQRVTDNVVFHTLMSSC